MASISFPSYEFKESARKTILSRIFYLSRPLEEGLSSQICSFSICTNMTLDQDVNYTSLNPAPFDILGCPPLISAPLGEGRRWRRRKKILFFLQKLLFSSLFYCPLTELKDHLSRKFVLACLLSLMKSVKVKV